MIGFDKNYGKIVTIRKLLNFSMIFLIQV